MGEAIVPYERFVEVRERRRRMVSAFTALSMEITRRHDATKAGAEPVLEPVVDNEPPTGEPHAPRSVIEMRRADPYIGGDHTLFSF